MRYAADPAAERLLVDLDGMIVLYHRPSGLTHLVTSPVPELLEALSEGPADAPALLARLSARYGIAAEGDACSVIEARLEELEALGLVSVRHQPETAPAPAPAPRVLQRDDRLVSLSR